MAMLTLVVPGSGSDYADLGLGFFGELDLPYNPSGVYLLGSNFGTTVRDQSGNGNDATIVGAPARSPLFATTQATATEAHCFVCPISADILASSGSACLVAIARLPIAAASGTLMVSNFPSSTPKSISLGTQSNSAAVQAYSGAGASGVVNSASLNVDDSRATRWGFYASNHFATYEEVHERHAGAARLSATSSGTPHASVPPGGALQMRIGAGYSTSSVFRAPVDMAAAAMFPRGLTGAELDNVYAAFSAFFAPRGLAL